MPETYGTTTGHGLQGPTEVRRHTLRSSSGLTVRLLDLGAAIDSVEIPGADGRPVPLVLGLPDLAAREDPTRNPFLGVTVGRWANRLRHAQFPLDGLTWALDANEGDHQLHGGSVGFSRFVWSGDSGPDSVTFRRHSPDREMGFPGGLDAEVTYRLDGRTIRITHTATTDAATIVSLTNHAYWNLGGPGEADIGDHRVALASDHVVPVDDDALPCGPPESVEGTVFDLRESTRLRDRLGFALPSGFDHCFMVEGTGLRRHARVDHSASGRSLEIWSDQPAVQFYTGAYLAGGPGADGRTHDPFSALCLEPQQVPDAPNLAWAPSPVLRPGERYVHQLELRLDWDGPDHPEARCPPA